MKIFYLLIICTLFSSCATTVYQINRVQSNNTIPKGRDFVYTDPNFIIHYDLWSNGGIMNFKIYNRTDTPIYIDWNKSNFILNDKSKDYWEDITTTKTNGSNVTTSYTTWSAVLNALNHDNITYGNYSSISIHEKDKPNSQLPPKSYIVVDRFNIGSPFWILPSYPKNNDSICQDFTDTNSVWKFRNYIAYTKNQDLSNVKFIDNSFWVNKLVTINSDKYDYGMSPVDTFTIHNRHPNSFYTNNSVSGSGSENNSAGLFLGILAVLVAIGAVLVLTHK